MRAREDEHYDVDLKLDWRNRICFVLAPGPSLENGCLSYVRAWRVAGARAIAVGDAYRLLPDADIIYHHDLRWWVHHEPQVRSLPGLKVSAGVVADWIEHIPSKIKSLHHPEFVREPWKVGLAGSTGFQAVNLALHTQASQVVLLGYDCHVKDGEHFFGKHPDGWANPTSGGLRMVAKKFTTALEIWPEVGDRIVNATQGSGITCFRQQRIWQIK